jgi:transposase
LEGLIEPDNEVRVIDALVDRLDLVELGFTRTQVKQYGSGSYDPAKLLKLYLYGYLNRIRSSRRLAKECQRNVELWWLLEELKPAYHTIADFRKENPKALKATFRAYNRMLKEFELFGAETIAIDGSKLRAQNAKKNNYNAAKIERQLDYLDDKLDDYVEELNRLDKGEAADEARRAEIRQDFKAKMARYDEYLALRDELEASGERQISTTDADARALPQHLNIVEVGYNQQMAVDDKHKLIVDTAVVNVRDHDQLYPMAQAAQEVLDSDKLQVLADKGYHTGEQLQKCAADPKLETYVAPLDNKNGPEGFRKGDFSYDEASDTYTCPEGETLSTNGKWYAKNTGKHRRSYRIKRYAAAYAVCAACEHAAHCNAGGMNSRHGRYVERSEYDGAVEANARRVAQNKELYRRRQAIVEHPFGTIKRAWGYTYYLLRGLEQVNGEGALLALTYNLRRSMSILGVAELVARLKEQKTARKGYFRVVWRQDSWCQPQKWVCTG